MIRRRDLLDDIYDYFKTEIENFNHENQKGMLDDLVDVILEINKGVNKVIKSQPKVGEWIPCSERLPEENTEVLIARKKNKYEINMGYHIKEVGWYDQCYHHFVDDVLAWMPLPAPYREDGV